MIIMIAWKVEFEILFYSLLTALQTVSNTHTQVD